MTISMYAISAPVFMARLAALSSVLGKGATFASDRKIDPQVLTSARLAPDMFPLTRQVQIAADHAKGACFRLAGREVPRFDDNEASFAELQERVARTIGLIEGFGPADIDGSEGRIIELRLGQRELSLTGASYLLDVALPNFYFHVTTAYGILRHNGVPLGKRDYLGAS